MARPTDSDRVREIRVGDRQIRVRLKEAHIDRLALDFCGTLEAAGIDYAIVGGYVAILLGRPRESDDVDILAAAVPRARFAGLHGRLLERFECHAAGSAKSLYDEYLARGPESTALRYSAPASFVPNIEFKFARTPLDQRAVDRRVAVDLNGHTLYIGPLEMQIGYKLYMAGPKDFEDARWICRVAEGTLDEGEVWRTARSLGVDEARGREILGL